MFSATFPKQIQTLASDFLNNYIFLTVGRVGSTSANITQRMEYIPEKEKVTRLLDLLERGHSAEMLTIVFTETKRGADYLDNYLHDRGFSSTCIHGDRNQREREEAVQLFKVWFTFEVEKNNNSKNKIFKSHFLSSASRINTVVWSSGGN